jgi:uncharacterized protein (UPF0332 family)
MTDEHARENARDELNKAKASLAAALALAGLSLWDDAVSRAYYAAFHAAAAVLFTAGLDAKSHQGVHDLLFAHFVERGPLPRRITKDLAALQRFREQADYSAKVRFDEATGREEVERAQRLVAELSAFLATRGVGGET